MKYTVKNFKAFGQDGVTFDLAPITMLTGCNCAGKSTLVKSLMILGDYFEKVSISYKRDGVKEKRIVVDQPLLFNVSHLQLGGFTTSINDKNKDGIMSFSYVKHSKFLNKNVVVSLSFVNNNDNQFTSNGKLHEISLQLENGGVFYRGERKTDGLFSHYLVDYSVIRDIYMFEMYQSILDQLAWDLNNDENLTPGEMGGIEAYRKHQIYRKLIPQRISLLKDFGSSNESQNNHRKMQQLCQRVLDVDRRIFNDYNILAIKKYNTLFYLPWFDILKDVQKSNVRSVMMGKLQGCELSENLQFNLDFVLADFENSEFNSFLDYFLDIEKKNMTFFTSDRSSSSLLWELSTGGNNYDDLTRISYLSVLDINRNFQLERFNDIVKLDKLYEVLAESYSIIDSEFAKHMSRSDYNLISFPNELFYCLQLYFSNIWEEVLIEDVPCNISNITYISSERAVAKRLYSFDHDDTDLNNSIQQYVELKKQIDDNIPKIKEHLIRQKQAELIRLYNQRQITKEEKEKVLLDFEKNINEELEQISFADTWMRKLDIGDSLSFDKVTDPIGNVIGCSISIVKDGKKYSIADEGYGCIQIISVLLAIQNTIFKFFINITSKSMTYLWKHNPIATGQLDFSIVIEEPENHLHPKLQSLLAEMFLDAYENYGIKFIIETHSEYMIRKSQALVAKMGFKSHEEAEEKSPFRTYYIPSNGAPYSLGYRMDGRFAESFGPGFYDESANLTFELL